MVRDRASSFILGLAGITPAASLAAHPGSQQQPGLVIVINGGLAQKVIEPLKAMPIFDDSPALMPKR